MSDDEPTSDQKARYDEAAERCDPILRSLVSAVDGIAESEAATEGGMTMGITLFEPPADPNRVSGS